MIQSIISPTFGRDSGQVILTFDDGPNPDADVTLKLLRTLDKYDIRACFAVVGQHISTSPALLRAYVEGGHLVINHGTEHRFLLPLSNQALINEVEGCEQAVQRALGEAYTMAFFRPPYGVLRTGQAKIIQAQHKALTPLSFFINDAWATPKNYQPRLKAITRAVIKRGGGAFVLHERRFSLSAFKGRQLDKSWLPSAVDTLVTELRAEGFTFTDYEQGFKPSER